MEKLPLQQNMDHHYHPSQRNHVYHRQHYYPVYEAVPPQTKVDQTLSPMNFGPWLHPGSYACPFPTGCHSCCSYSPFGYCSYWHPYSYIPLLPSMFAPRPCQPCSDHHGYAIPPSHYPTGIAQYEYDKSAGKDHYCGCPNHTCQEREKIEEQMPETTQKWNDSFNAPHMQGHPYPVVWVPQSHGKDLASYKSSEPKSNVSNGCYPLGLKHVHPMKEDPQFPSPVFLVPSYSNPENQKHASPTFKAAEGQEPKLKIMPLKFIEDDKRGYNLDAAGKGPVNGVSVEVPAKETCPVSGATIETNDSCRELGNNCIPVKQVEGGITTSSEFQEATKKSGSPAIQQESNAEKTVESNRKKQSTSPVKALKLPPVCLRVDPLPRKRMGNGTSRSPSPLRGKERSQQDHTGDKPFEDELKEEKPSKKEIKVIEVQGKQQSLNNIEAKPFDEMRVLKADKLKDGSSIEREVKDVKVLECAEHYLKENEMAASCKEKTAEGLKGGDKDKPAKDLGLSCEDAAVRIQSAYRGFEVRRWEPLKKLKQIAKVREQVIEVKDKVCELETNAELLQDEKQRAVTNETIMCLLLQLDAVQGLHPSVRDVRKSVAKELICLQEKLDAIVCAASNKMIAAKSVTIDGAGGNNDEINIDRSLERADESQEEGSKSSDSQPDGSSVLEERKFGELPVVEHEVEECKSVESTENRTQDFIVEEPVTEQIISVLPLESTNERTVREESTLEQLVDSGFQEASLLGCLEIQEQGDSRGLGVGGPGEVAIAAEGETNSFLEEVPQSEIMESSETVVDKDVADDGVRSERDILETVNEDKLGVELTESIFPSEKETTMEGFQYLFSGGVEPLELVGASSALEANGAEPTVGVDAAEYSNAETGQEGSEKKFIAETSPLEMKETLSGQNGNYVELACSEVASGYTHKEEELRRQLMDETSSDLPSLPDNLPGPTAAEVNTVSGVAAMTEIESTVPSMMAPSDETLYALSPLEENVVGECSSLAADPESAKAGVVADVTEVECHPPVSKEARCSLAITAEQLIAQFPGSSAFDEAKEAITMSKDAQTVGKDAEKPYIMAAPCSSQLAADDSQLDESAEVTGAQACMEGSHMTKDNDLMEENEKLRKILENLIAAGREQLSAVNDLSRRVRDLERQMTRGKKLKASRQRRRQSSCGALINNVQGKSLHRVSAV